MIGVDVQRIRRALELQAQRGNAEEPALDREQINRFERHLRRELERDLIERKGELAESRMYAERLGRELRELQESKTPAADKDAAHAELLQAAQKYLDMIKFVDQIAARLAKLPAKLSKETQEDFDFRIDFWRKYARLGQSDIAYRAGRYDEVLKQTDEVIKQVEAKAGAGNDPIRLKDYQVTNDVLGLALRAKVQKGQIDDAKRIRAQLSAILPEHKKNTKSGTNPRAVQFVSVTAVAGGEDAPRRVAEEVAQRQHAHHGGQPRGREPPPGNLHQPHPTHRLHKAIRRPEHEHRPNARDQAEVRREAIVESVDDAPQHAAGAAGVPGLPFASHHRRQLPRMDG